MWCVHLVYVCDYVRVGVVLCVHACGVYVCGACVVYVWCMFGVWVCVVCIYGMFHMYGVCVCAWVGVGVSCVTVKIKSWDIAPYTI